MNNDDFLANDFDVNGKKKIIANESGCVSISHKIDELYDVIAGNSRIPFIYS